MATQGYAPAYGYPIEDIQSAARFLATDYYSAERWLRDEDRKLEAEGYTIGKSYDELPAYSAQDNFYADCSAYREKV